MDKLKIFLFLFFLIASIILFNIVCLFAFFAQILRKILRCENLKKYFLTCAIAEDQRAGSYLYGTEDFTISSYTYFLAMKKNNIFAFYFMQFIDFFAYLLGDGKEHCKKAYEKEDFELKNGGARFSTKQK